jgi:hypothetical protein
MRPTAITIKFDDGSVQYANGDAAVEIMRWWSACELMAAQHGAKYTGPKLRRIDCIPQADDMSTEAIVITNAGKP